MPPRVMPFCVAGVPLVPVIHVAAIMGETVPFWDQRDEFGDTNLLVVKQEEGRSLARALGPHSAVLMRRHGATVVGGNVRELVFRSIAMCQNAEYQMRALTLGSFGPLTPGETKLAAAINLSSGPLARAWEYWTARAESPPAALTDRRMGFPTALIDIVFSPLLRPIGGDRASGYRLPRLLTER